jgi:8-oxo-dGTP pyrophosphatase MutT (NUDIX family)
MALQVVHSPEELPETITSTVFLAGPSPRKEGDPNWRPEAIEALRRAGYRGTVLVPVPRNGEWPRDYNDQIAWESAHLAICDVILMWVPRDLEVLPGFTTNVEFGEWLHSGKLLYGRPPDSPKTGYLDARYRSVSSKQKPPFDQPVESLDQLAQMVVQRLGEGAARTIAERQVPLAVWRTPQFQSWYRELTAAGNRLDGARVLWSFFIPQANNLLLSYALHVKVWVAAERRHKENEFVLSRPDIAAICAFCPNEATHALLDTRIVLVREFRSPGRTVDGFVHDLPGGSTFKPGTDPREVAAAELQEETGMTLPAERFLDLGARQLVAPFSTHKSHLFVVRLTPAELAEMERREREGQTFGVEADTERTQLEVRTLRQILEQRLVDHASVGMLMQACLHTWVETGPPC